MRYRLQRTAYYFLKNLQGDIIAIVNENRETVARYRYDAWGVCTIISDTSNCNIATINPFRYRGYYYDTETGFYYLQSRYYDPVVGRFLNRDAVIGANGSIVGYNSFAYCDNNPVIKYDPTGYDAVVLTDTTLHGHTGIMVQDEDGTWYHYFWGPVTKRSALSFNGCDAETWCVKYEGEITLEAINASGQYEGTYEKIVRLEGDFSECIPYMGPEGEYNLYTNNCLHKSMSILKHGPEKYLDAITKASKQVLPVVGHKILVNNLPKASKTIYINVQVTIKLGLFNIRFTRWISVKIEI